MPHICPRPCSRLATAAVFISVGVVQFVVGIILLRSKYVYLLAGPDFWTASCNIAVGCLLGMSASVWKQSRKRQSKKHALRRNLLIALLFSALILNSTTLGLFLLGEGNTLLSIRLESDGKYSESSFAGEILAYAYVTSVCCPIVCIVVSIVSISGSCCKYAIESNAALNKLDNNGSRSLGWIYTPELFDLPKRKIRDLVLSSSDSSDDELDIPTYEKHTDSSDDIQHVLKRMADGKRDSLLSDSAIMLRQLDLRRKNRYNSINPDGSYIGPELSRSRESTLDERNPGLTRYDDLPYQGTKKAKRYHSDINGNTRSPPDAVSKRINYSKSKQLASLYRNKYASEELLNEYHNASSRMAKHYPSQYRKFRQLQSRSEVNVPSLSCNSDEIDYGSIYNNGRKKTSKMSRSAECISQKSSFASPNKHEIVEEKDKRQRCKTIEQTPPGMIDCFSPDELDDLPSDISRTSSWAGEVIPITVKQSSVARLSNKLIPVPIPVVPPLIQQKEHFFKTSDDSGIGIMESNSFTEVTSDFKDRNDNLSSFLEDSKVRNNENAQQYPKIGSQSVKKFDLNKISTMASISEEPNMDVNRWEEKANSQGETASRKTKSRSRKKFSVRSEYPKNQDEAISIEDITPKRKTFSGRSLKKLWSSSSENQTDFLDQVVDEDSLIGLTEEELIARQLRTRSIRKAIQQRIKEEISV